MTKKQIIEQIDMLSMLQRHAINERRQFADSFLGTLKIGEVGAYGTAIAILASGIGSGFASKAWHKPAELRAAA